MYVCMHACIHTDIHTYINTYIHNTHKLRGLGIRVKEDCKGGICLYD